MRKKFISYVIPSVLSMLVFSLYTMVDGLFVAKGVGERALAAVNISMPFVNGAFALAIIFAVGTSTIAAISLGNGENNNANQVFTMNMAVLTILGLATTVIVLLNLEKIAYFLGATKSTISYVKDYLGIISAFSVLPILSYYLEVLVKTDGHPRLATFGVCIAAIANIVLDYVFVIKLGYGVKGAAFATVMAQAASIIFFLGHFLFNSSRIKFVPFKLDLSVIKRTLPIGASDFITEFSISFIVFLFNRTILNYVGETGIITYTVIMYLNNLVIMIMSGISQGIQPLVSYNYGKEDKKSLSYFLKKAFKTVGVSSLIIYASCIIFAEQIIGLFINKAEVELFYYSVKAIKWYAPVYLILGFNIVLTGFYAAIERPLYSMIISLGRGFIVITASLYIMTSLIGAKGIWLSSFVSEIICLIIAITISVKFFFSELFQNILEKEPLGDYD